MSEQVTVSRNRNDAVIESIRAHHAELAGQLHDHTAAVLAAAQDGDADRARDALHEWYGAQLLPHVAAEEQALYGVALQIDATRLLVSGMLAEHRALKGLIDELAHARSAADVAIAAASAEALFQVHLEKENDLMLPALAVTDGVDLAAVLAGMHEILGEAAAASDAELDVRRLPHGQRHEIIFAKLDALVPGESLIIVNDHDSKPLRYQTSALWPERYAWNYREAGPEIWRVAITRAG
ncbi:MAG TPA: DUF2249 domain-containing protein [Jatrophihabitans sp.]|nr:DUF2249 domain-containing protein [Jatrophihabitans sp.]